MEYEIYVLNDSHILGPHVPFMTNSLQNAELLVEAIEKELGTSDRYGIRKVGTVERIER